MIARLAGRLLPPLILLVALCLLWDRIVVWNNLKPFFFPGPLAVLKAIQTNHLELARALGVTALAALGGFTASLVVGTAIAFVFSLSRTIRVSCYPYAILLQTVPIVAVAPIIVIWFGHGFRSIVIVSFILSLFPIITSATTGMLSVDPDLLDLFRLHRAGRFRTWLKLRLPGSIPHILTGAKISSGLAVIGSIVGEFFAGYATENYGLGYVIQQTHLRLKTPDLFAAVLASTFLGIAVFGTISLAGTFIRSRWYDPER